ncbi:MAG: hypothetical protein HKL87_02050 [Acidimicrobiaceae bacterium]|nr:hypothetical protein [Acidimicrobiaceae bacterium]
MTQRRRRAPTPSGAGPWNGHVTREGRPKVAYRTRTEALSAAQLAWTINRADLEAYRCDYCHQWHIGGSSRRD